MSVVPIKMYRKTTAERRRLYINYECWLAEAEKLTSFTAVITPTTTGAALVVNTSYPDATFKKLVMYASGGKANTTYTIAMIVNTDGGQTKQDNIGILVT
jgi:hypothetical protein